MCTRNESLPGLTIARHAAPMIAPAPSDLKERDSSSLVCPRAANTSGGKESGAAVQALGVFFLVLRATTALLPSGHCACTRPGCGRVVSLSHHPARSPVR